MKKEKFIETIKKAGEVVRTNLTDLGAAFLPTAGGEEKPLPSRIVSADQEKKQG